MLLLILGILGLGGFWWYADARVDSYVRSSGKLDVARIINACVADLDSEWQLPFCRRGYAAFGLSSNDCRATHLKALFFVEKRLACDWLDENVDEVVHINSGYLRDGGTRNPLHELVRRHAWCQDMPPPCTKAETRQHRNWCLPKPDECMRAQLRSIDWLLDRGVDINQFEYGDMTVLHYAVREDDYLAIQELLKRGANPTITAESESAITAIERARQRVEVYFNGRPSPAVRRTLELLESQQAPPE